MTKVEPSGDDTLTEILTDHFEPTCSESCHAEHFDADLAEARTQLLQYIEGEKAKARVEELENIKAYGSYGIDRAYSNEPFIVVPVSEVDERLTQFKEQSK